MWYCPPSLTAPCDWQCIISSCIILVESIQIGPMTRGIPPSSFKYLSTTGSIRIIVLVLGWERVPIVESKWVTSWGLNIARYFECVVLIKQGEMWHRDSFHLLAAFWEFCLHLWKVNWSDHYWKIQFKAVVKCFCRISKLIFHGNPQRIVGSICQFIDSFQPQPMLHACRNIHNILEIQELMNGC